MRKLLSLPLAAILLTIILAVMPAAASASHDSYCGFSWSGQDANGWSEHYVSTYVVYGGLIRYVYHHNGEYLYGRYQSTDWVLCAIT